MTPEKSMRLCGDCALCCSYVTVEITEPKTVEDVDYFLWLVHHKNVSIFKDPEGWYVQFQTPCKNHDKKCQIYEERPHICSDYTHDDCDLYGKDEDDTTYLKETEEVKSYLKKHKPDLWKLYTEKKRKE
jgi:uncharacterized protein